jgi:uncharacterized membrane protein YccF (DUF307 family)
MSLIGNIIWFIIGGLPAAIGWFVAGILWGVTIIGIPVARQCFKMAGFQLAPFGRKVVHDRESPLGFVANVVWLVFGGVELALINLLEALIFAITIIGLPFAKQSIKLAQLSLAPFGRSVVRVR